MGRYIELNTYFDTNIQLNTVPQAYKLTPYVTLWCSDVTGKQVKGFSRNLFFHQ